MWHSDEGEEHETFDLHAIDGRHRWQVFLEIFDAVYSARALEIGDDGSKLLRIAVDFLALE